MQGRSATTLEGSAQTADAIQAFCRHLGELCDVLAAPYDAEALARAASGEELQGTNCSVLLHKALYHWLGERVELSLGDEDNPEEAARRARESALSELHDHDILSEFVQAVVGTCTNADAMPEAPPERGMQSLLFDLQGPIDLLGPDEVDSLLSELTTSDSPVSALEALSSDVHLLEDLCFGPTWPQLCDALGRLVCLPAAAAGGPAPQPPQPLQQQAPPQQQAHAQAQVALPLPRQQQLLLTVLQELASSVAASSPPHAAELLDAMAPHMTALVLRLALPGGGGGSSAAAPGLLSAAEALDPFAVGLMRIAHQLLAGLAGEYHMLPPGCAALAARAVCDVVRAGLARGAPTPEATAAAAPPPSPSAAATQEEDPMVDLSALDLLVLFDPELRWWQRLCAATHATQPVADAAAATHLAAALEAALQAWAAAAAAVSNSGGGGYSGALTGGVGGTAAGGRSPTHLVACTALLGGLVRANSLALLGCESRSGGGAGGCQDGAAEEAPPPPLPQVRPTAAAAAAPTAPVLQQERLRLQRMLGHLLGCFCIASDRPWLFRPNGSASKAATAAATAGATHSSGGSSGQGGSVFLLLAADVLSSAAALGKLPLLAPPGSGTAVWTPLLQAMLRGAALTASAAAQGHGATASATAVVEVEAWLAAAARVVSAATDHAMLAAAGSETAGAVGPAAAVSGAPREPPSSSPPAAADAICALLRHVAGRLRGCAAAAASAAPAWTLPVVRAAAALAAASPAAAAALQDLYDTLHTVLAARAAAASRSGQVSLASSPSRRAGGNGRNGTGEGAHLGPHVSLIDILDSRGTLGTEPTGASTDSHGADPEPDELDELELLAAEAVLSYCRTDFSVPATVAAASAGDLAACSRAAVSSSSSAAAVAALGPPPPMLLQLPAALQRQLFLECAARLLCEEYGAAGGSAPSGGGGGSGGARVGGAGAAGGLGVRCTAAKRRVARRAEALACCCLAGQQALVAAGFPRRVLDDVAAVLRSGEYEPPYLEPLPYADPLAGLCALLAGVLCWPGLLRLSEGDEGEQPGARRKGVQRSGAEVGGPVTVAAGGGGGASSLELRHRREVLALLQELVIWLDPRGAECGCLPPTDAAAVSLRAFSVLVAADPSAGAALERDTNIRWYLQSLCGTLPQEEGEEGEVVGAGGNPKEGGEGEGPALMGSGGAGGGRPAPGGAGTGAQQPQAPQQAPQQQDMLLDLARAVLRATTAPRGASNVA